MNIVSIMAHADDEMNCLGTMLKCRARGDHLYFITVTDGSKGFVQNPNIPPSDAAQIRYAEMSALASKVSAGYLNLHEPDEFLFDSPTVRMNLIEAIRQTQADVIFTHYETDYNADHITVNHLVRHCTMQACLPVLPTQSPPLKDHPAVFQCEPAGNIHFPASHYVDIGAYHEEKGLLLASHVSQEEAMFSATGFRLGDLCARVEAFRGQQVGCLWAEAFVPLPGRGSIKPYPVLP